VPADYSVVMLPVASTGSDFMGADHRSSLAKQAGFAACFALALLMLGLILGPGWPQRLLLGHRLGHLQLPQRLEALRC